MLRFIRQVIAGLFDGANTSLYEPRHEKTGLRGFRPGLTQTDLYSHRSRIEAGNFGFNKKRNCTIHVTKTKALISFAVTAKLICAFVFRICNNPVFSRRGSYVFQLCGSTDFIWRKMHFLLN